MLKKGINGKGYRSFEIDQKSTECLQWISKHCGACPFGLFDSVRALRHFLSLRYVSIFKTDRNQISVDRMLIVSSKTQPNSYQHIDI